MCVQACVWVKIFKFMIDTVVVFVQSKAEDAPASKDAVSSVVSRLSGSAT